MSNNKFTFFTSFPLKIIAILAVLSDHIALLFLSMNSPLYIPLRIIGRLAFVLFAFFISEGVVHSKKPLHYLLRLTILYVVLQIFIISANLYSRALIFRNVFLTLLSGASLLVYFRHKRYKDWYLLLPVLAAITLNSVAFFYPTTKITIFAGDYGNYGITLIIMFYLARLAAQYFMKGVAQKYQMPFDVGPFAQYEQFVTNIFSSISLFITTALWYILSVFDPRFTPYSFQTWALLAGIILLVYNGKIGHNSRGWRYFYYAFFPLHLLILTLLTFII